MPRGARNNLTPMERLPTPSADSRPTGACYELRLACVTARTYRRRGLRAQAGNRPRMILSHNRLDAGWHATATPVRGRGRQRWGHASALSRRRVGRGIGWVPPAEPMGRLPRFGARTRVARAGYFCLLPTGERRAGVRATKCAVAKCHTPSRRVIPSNYLTILSV
jgi:hypothetical protein